MQATLANPRGFCAGVDRAIDIVNRALEIFGAPVYVRHEVVHNKTVVNDLKSRGAVFVDELDEVPDDTIVIFSAHGVSRAVRDEAARRKLKVFDATCPLVTKVHLEVVKFSEEGRECILIGHAGHPEVEGTMGQFDRTHGGVMKLVQDEQEAQTVVIDDPKNVSFVTQTTYRWTTQRELLTSFVSAFRTSKARERTIFAMPHRTGKMQSNGSLWSMILFWWSALQTHPTPTDSENLLSDWARRHI